MTFCIWWTGGGGSGNSHLNPGITGGKIGRDGKVGQTSEPALWQQCPFPVPEMSWA